MGREVFVPAGTLIAVELLRTPEEECAASDKDDWQIDMPDGDKNDNIEEASVDDDTPHTRARPRLSS